MASYNILEPGIMRNVRTCMLLLCAALPAPQLRCEVQSSYKALVGKAEKMSSKSIIRQADTEAAKGEEEKALILYTLVCNRYSDGMPENEKPYCSLAHIKAGNLYFDRGSYTNALETAVMESKDNVINVQNLPSGIYFLNVNTGNTTETHKVMIK